MLVLAAGSILYDTLLKKDRAKGKANKIALKPIRNLFLFLLIGVGFAGIVFAITQDERTIEFSLGVLLSSLTSFGGGEAYIAVADAVFVQTGLVSEEVYYSRIIGISSAMPGPVLVTIAAGLGFAYGSAMGGYLLGWIYGLLAITLAVVATAFGALTLYSCFGVFKESHRLQMIVRYMIPMVCGLLITVGLTLLNQAAGVMTSEGVPPLLAVGIVAALFFIMLTLRIKFRVGDIKLLLGGGLSILAVMSVLF